MIQKRLESIDNRTITELIANGVAESRTLEYKSVLPGSTDAEVKEFLLDVASFANGQGGDLVLGVAAGAGIPKSADGLPGYSETVRIALESKIRDGLVPRIQGLQLREIHGFSKGPVVVLRVPRSWNGPHMLTYRSSSHFAGRHSGGKYRMDIDEIRDAFLQMNSIPAQLRALRDERVSLLLAGDAPVVLVAQPQLIIQLVPLPALAGKQAIAIDAIWTIRSQLRPPMVRSWDERINIDGVVVFGGPSGTAASSAYVQAFRTGIVEAGAANVVMQEKSGLAIAAMPLEVMVVEGVERWLGAMRALGVAGPVVAMISLNGVRDAELLPITGRGLVPVSERIDRDRIHLPEVVLEDSSSNIPSALRPAFDGLWNAAGWPGSNHYKKDGSWAGEVYRGRW